MGIVAHCPNGHRIKVKDRFAGRRGLCPTCGAKFRIPRLADGVGSPPAGDAAQGSLPLARAVGTTAATAQPLAAAIAERADLSWCIAVPGGSPSEPLDRRAMQQWLVARRATGGELVWRADWPDWRPVRAVFPEFFSGS